jgi:neutral ceramidase
MRLFYAAVVLAGTLTGADFQAGLARLKITPEGPIWLSGYAARKHASEGVVHDLWAKALALESSKGGRVVIVTTDLIGLPRAITELVAARVEKQYGLERARLVLNSSHTHTGPVLRANLSAMYDLSPEDDQRINDYSRTLTDALAQEATGRLTPEQAIDRALQTAEGKRLYQEYIAANPRQ